jgi:hypothetical protein
MKLFVLLGLLLSSYLSGAQFYVKTEPNYDESKVPEFIVSDPLRTFKGRKVKNVRVWQKKRRPELLNFFTENVYGKVPGELKISDWKVVEEGDNAINGKAIRKQVDIIFEKGDNNLHFNILMYLPKNVEKAPLF